MFLMFLSGFGDIFSEIMPRGAEDDIGNFFLEVVGIFIRTGEIGRSLGRECIDERLQNGLFLGLGDKWFSFKGFFLPFDLSNE